MLTSGFNAGKLLRLMIPLRSSAVPTTRKLASSLSTDQPSGNRISTSSRASLGPLAGVTDGSAVGLGSVVGDADALDDDGDAEGPLPFASSEQPASIRLAASAMATTRAERVPERRRRRWDM